ncbi:MAG: flagellin [Lachnospiraceae bacterium]|nr:flagellin [Lachnospiraceae bacterium]
MVIQHNLAGLNSKRNQKINESKLKRNLEKLSSGYRINRSGDDVAGLAISESLRSQINGLNQAQDNIGDAINLIQTSEGAMQEVHAMLERMYQCSVGASNGTYTDEIRNIMTTEVDQLKEEIQRIAKDTSFYFVGMLESKGTEDAEFQIGASEEEVLKVDLPDLGLGASRLNIEDVSIGTQDAAHDAIPVLKEAIDYVSAERGRMGAYQNRLEYAERSIGVASENLTAAESRIRDTDMADEITSYTKNNIVRQAAESMLTQANAMPQNVLNILQ